MAISWGVSILSIANLIPPSRISLSDDGSVSAFKVQQHSPENGIILSGITGHGVHVDWFAGLAFIRSITCLAPMAGGKPFTMKRFSPITARLTGVRRSEELCNRHLAAATCSVETRMPTPCLLPINPFTPLSVFTKIMSSGVVRTSLAHTNTSVAGAW